LRHVLGAVGGVAETPSQEAVAMLASQSTLASQVDDVVVL
jgi:hypothetical protein